MIFLTDFIQYLFRLCHYLRADSVPGNDANLTFHLLPPLCCPQLSIPLHFTTLIKSSMYKFYNKISSETFQPLVLFFFFILFITKTYGFKRQILPDYIEKKKAINLFRSVYSSSFSFIFPLPPPASLPRRWPISASGYGSSYCCRTLRSPCHPQYQSRCRKTRSW